MTKPFRLTGAPAADAAPKQLTPSKNPVQVLDATEDGPSLPEVLREVRVPDRAVGAGEPKNVAAPGQPPAPVYPEEKPWGPAGRYNDAGKPPMRLK